MTPFTLFISALLYIAACLLPGGNPNEKKTSELPQVSQEVQNTSK